MQVLILGEGTTDLGRFDLEGVLERPGVLPALVGRLLQERAPALRIEFRVRPFKQIRRNPRAGVGRSTYGFANKLAALLGMREGRDADCIVAVTDRDGPTKTDKIEELNRGREELRASRKACAVGVAVEEIEAWLLADEKALRQVLQSDAIMRQPAPEALTARDEASDNNPKGRLQRMIADSPVAGEPVAAVCANIAAIADLQVIAERCPIGFDPFARQLRELLSVP